MQPRSSGTGVSPVYGRESRGCGGAETHGRDARATTRRENLRRLRELLGIVVQMNRIKRHELHRLWRTELNRRNRGENEFSKSNLFFRSVSIRVNSWFRKI